MIPKFIQKCRAWPFNSPDEDQKLIDDWFSALDYDMTIGHPYDSRWYYFHFLVASNANTI